jgi:hypothetical protein
MYTAPLLAYLVSGSVVMASFQECDIQGEKILNAFPLDINWQCCSTTRCNNCTGAVALSVEHYRFFSMGSIAMTLYAVCATEDKLFPKAVQIESGGEFQ